MGNLPFHTSWQDLKGYDEKKRKWLWLTRWFVLDTFKVAGTVVRAEVLAVDGKPRGAGTVLFDSPEAANKAIQTFNSATMDGRVITVKLDRKAN